MVGAGVGGETPKQAELISSAGSCPGQDCGGKVAGPRGAEIGTGHGRQQVYTIFCHFCAFN